ncbi:FAD/NAD(P)-binding domain-containing protein [Thozetella sp. PMI_491]|nr:FAD/NAD(P)-binding domain-containing protein [Thozetella sp. PMI_491]
MGSFWSSLGWNSAPSGTDEERLEVIIVGAGLGGLGAAISCRAGGHSVRVLEQAKTISEIGAGLQITPNGSRLLQHWKLPESFWATVAEPTEVLIHQHSGEVLYHEAGFDKAVRRKYGAPFVDVHRADLQQALYARALELGVQFSLDERVVSLDLNQARPLLRTDAGHDFTADIVIGADGLWSQCRQAALGVGLQPKPTGDLAYRIVLKLDEILDEDLKAWVKNPKVHFWIGPGTHVVGYSLRGGDMYNLVLLSPDNMAEKVSKESASVEEMRELFSTWDPTLQRFLSYVNNVDKWKLMHMEELPHWVNEQANLVFLGDACHPMLPYLAQGANSSLEDGAVLGTLLSKVKDKSGVPDALRRYEVLRKERGEAIVRETFNQRADFHMTDEKLQLERNKILRQGPSKNSSGSFPSRWNCPNIQPWLYGYDAIASAEKEVLA